MQFIDLKTQQSKIKDKINDNYNLINNTGLINDFVFICYLVGNDFLPHLPSLNITKKGLDHLLDTYTIILVNYNYKNIINTKNHNMINQEMFNDLINLLATEEANVLKYNYNKRKKYYKCKSNDKYDKEINRIENLRFKIKDTIQLGSDDSKQWKERYYTYYFGTTKEDQEEFVKEMTKHYLKGLVWVTKYYFDKCCSWEWYFPYDHPLFLEDLNKNLKFFPFKNIKFNKSKPLKPFIQLLSVLPPQSNYLLPKPLRKLMKYSSSLAHLYPDDFTQDFINKDRYWKAIPNLPPLEISLIKRTYAKYVKKLSKEDLERNKNIKNYYFNK